MPNTLAQVQLRINWAFIELVERKVFLYPNQNTKPNRHNQHNKVTFLSYFVSRAIKFDNTLELASYIGIWTFFLF